MELFKDDFEKLKKILEHNSGIKLTDAKMGLMKSRLFKRLIELEITNAKEYYNYLNIHHDEIPIFINLMTTNKTDFFRDPDQFEYLKTKVIPKLKERTSTKPIHIWSAASSTGEEAYSLAMLFREEKIGYRILGTDIDNNVLSHAENGVYNEDQLGKLSEDRIKDHFYSGTGIKRGHYKIKEVISKNIKFRKFNLMEDKYAFPITFDIIFLKNAFIYFRSKTIEEIVNKIYDLLPKGGIFVISPSESLLGINNPFVLKDKSIFVKEGING